MIPIKKASILLAASLTFVSCGSNSGTPLLASKTRAGESAAQQLYNSGYALEAAGKRGKAMKEYKEITKKYPLSPIAGNATYRYAKLLENDREPLDAFEAYNALLTKYPASPHYADAMKRQEIIAHQVAQGHIKSSFIGFKSRIDITRTAKMLGQVRDNAPRAFSAEKAQFTIGEVFQTGDSKEAQSIEAYRTVVRDYPDSKYAPEAQYRIGAILLKQAAEGNEDAANLDRARKALDDVLIRYPNHPRAADARREIAKINSGDIQRSYDVAEFYRKKGQTASALFYYREAVRKAKPGPLRSRAQAWIAKLSS
ncbi:tetratricopeptide repeat protein [Verrucomicrobiaceae bacterium 227]